MKINQKKSNYKIVELFGLPGVGKTTFAKKIINDLSDEYAKIYEIRDVYFYKEGNKTKILTLILMFVSPFRLKLNIFLLVYLLSNKISFHKVKYGLKLLKFVFQIDRVAKISKEDEIIFLEEGVVQYLAAICMYDKRIQLNNAFYKYLSSRYDNHLAFSCVLDVERVFKHIRSRNSAYHKFDAIENDKELLLRLTFFGSNLFMISKYMNKNKKKTILDFSLDLKVNIKIVKNAIRIY